jgi:sugar/nucleoside kinase (ribokinase family)
MDNSYLDHIRKLCPITVLTRGEDGLTVFKGQEEPVCINPFKLGRNELKDFTGAGDSSAAAFMWHYFGWHNAKEAGAFAALYPALKIMGIGGKEGGINALPTLEQVQKFILQNRERVLEFYRSNELEFPLFLEGNKNSLERK